MYINNIKFARNNQQQKGVLDLKKLSRVQEIDDYAGEIDYELTGFVDKLNRPTLSLRVYGTIHTLCQNCLQPMDVAIDNTSKITVFFSEEDLDAALFADAGSGVEDGVVAEEEFDVMQLVEDEIIMLLPYATKHETCVGMSYADKAENPFEVLKKII